MLHIILCDDNPRHNQTMTHHLTQILPRLPMEANIALATTDPQQVIEFAKAQKGDSVYLLDLELDNRMNGLELCTIIHRLQPTALVIYVSAYAEYALDCFRSHAYDFILKPYTNQRLENALRDVLLFFERRRAVYPLTVTAGSMTRMLDQKEICWLEIEREYVTAHMTAGTFTWRESLTKLMPRLNPAWFVRIHKSCAVNRLYVENVNSKAHEVTMKGGKVLSVSRRLIGELTADGAE
jgi:DNA-binding LytR/AlgR family response regulator